MTTVTDLPRLLTAREAAEHLRISLDHLYRLVGRGALPAVRLTERGNLRFRPTDVEAALVEVCGCGTSVREAVEPAVRAEGPALPRSGADPDPSAEAA